MMCRHPSCFRSFPYPLCAFAGEFGGNYTHRHTYPSSVAHETSLLKRRGKADHSRTSISLPRRTSATLAGWSCPMAHGPQSSPCSAAAPGTRCGGGRVSACALLFSAAVALCWSLPCRSLHWRLLPILAAGVPLCLGCFCTVWALLCCFCAGVLCRYSPLKFLCLLAAPCCVVSASAFFDADAYSPLTSSLCPTGLYSRAEGRRDCTRTTPMSWARGRYPGLRADAAPFG